MHSGDCADNRSATDSAADDRMADLGRMAVRKGGMPMRSFDGLNNGLSNDADECHDMHRGQSIPA
jgi:hypothetical protein